VPVYETHTHTTVLLLCWNLPGTTRVSRYQKGYNQSGFTGARDSEWQWHLLGYMQVCTPCRQPRQHPTTQFFTGRVPFLTPNQQRQSTGQYMKEIDKSERERTTLIATLIEQL